MNSADIPDGAALFNGSTFVNQQNTGQTQHYRNEQAIHAAAFSHGKAADNGWASNLSLAPNNSQWTQYRETIQQAEWLDSAFKRTCFGLGLLSLLWLGFFVYGVSQTS